MEYKTHNTIGLRVEVLRRGGVYTTLEPYTVPEVQNLTTSALKMSFRGSFLPVDEDSLPVETVKEAESNLYMTADGASYGFTYDSSAGMIVSNNGGVDSSIAVARLDVTSEVPCTVVLGLVNSGEAKWDYGLVYNVDYTPTMLYTDESNVFYTFAESTASSTEATVEVPMDAGTHFIHIAFKKDTSNSSNSDRLAIQSIEIRQEAAGGRGINWLTDRIRPVLIINGAEYPCGVFIGTTPEKTLTGGRAEVSCGNSMSCEATREIWSIEAYSPLYLANRVKIEGSYTIPAGTNYIAAVQELLRTAGITAYAAEETDLVLATDRADWPSGTPVLTVINQLLSEINYRSAWVDLTGTVRLTKYVSPSADNIRHTYSKGEYSIISGEAKSTTDYFDKANVFRAVCSSPDLDEPLVATTENADPNSPYSTVSLGVRILQEETVDSVPDLATLQERAEIMLTKSLQTTETIEFVTALCPVHETFDTVALDLGEITGIFTETGWTMLLDASGEMRHTAERVVYK